MNPCSRLQTTNHPFFLKRQEIRKQASRLLLSVNQITVILEACLPFGPVVISKETRWFSFRDLKPSALMAEKWAKTSSPPSSGVMNPKPLESLNHFTVPVAITNFLFQLNQAFASTIV